MKTLITVKLDPVDGQDFSLLDALHDANTAKRELIQRAGHRCDLSEKNLLALIGDAAELGIDADGLALYRSAARGIAIRLKQYRDYPVGAEMKAPIALYEDTGAIWIGRPDTDGVLRITLQFFDGKVVGQARLNPLEVELLQFKAGVTGLLPWPHGDDEMNEDTPIYAAILIAVPPAHIASVRTLAWVPPDFLEAENGDPGTTPGEPSLETLIPHGHRLRAMLSDLELGTLQHFDPDHATALLGLGATTIYQWFKTGRVASERVNGHVKIPRIEFQRLAFEKFGGESERLRTLNQKFAQLKELVTEMSELTGER